MRLLTRADVHRAISMPEAIQSVKQAFIELSTGSADIPLRTAISQSAHQGVMLFMPGYLRGIEALAIKVVSIHNRNPSQNLPRINALVAVFDPATGIPVAVMDGGYLTSLRTGAGSGVATDLLARKDAKFAAIFGAGVQARTQLLAVAAVRSIERFLIYSHNHEKIQAMIGEVKQHLDPSIEILPAHSPSEAISNADIICTATNSLTPVFPGSELKAGAHINAIGSYQPEVQEIDCETIKRTSKIVVDTRESALSEAGDLLIPIGRGDIQISDIYGEIGEIAVGFKPGRESREEITLFKSVGTAAQDAAVALTIYRHALKGNFGVEIEL